MSFESLTRTEIVLASVGVAFYIVNFLIDQIRNEIKGIMKWYHYKKYKDYGKYNEAIRALVQKRKPIDCLACMSGWCCFLYCFTHGCSFSFSYLMCLCAISLGAIIDRINKRI